MSKLREIFFNAAGRFRACETLLWLILISACVVASPFVMRQFASLSKTGDIVWNTAFDLMVAFAVMLVFVLLGKLIRKFELWLDRTEY